MNTADSNGKEQGVSVEVLEERIAQLSDAANQQHEDLWAALRKREDSNEGMRVRIEAVDAKIESHEKICAQRWGELVGGMRIIRWGLGVLLTMVSVVIGLLALRHH